MNVAKVTKRTMNTPRSDSYPANIIQATAEFWSRITYDYAATTTKDQKKGSEYSYRGGAAVGSQPLRAAVYVPVSGCFRSQDTSHARKEVKT